MKAMLFAAGKGERLKPLTDKMPKCLLPVGGEPLLNHWIRLLSMSGVKDILINLHYMSEKVVDYVGSLGMDGVRFTFSYEKELLGSAGTLFRNKSFFRGEFAALIAYADVWTNMDLKKMINYHRKRPGIATIGLFEPTNPEHAANCGIVEISRGTVVSFEEKPKKPKGKLAFAGMAVLHPSALRNLTPQMHDIAKDFLPTLAGKINAFIVRDVVHDIGVSVEHYEDINDEVKRMGLKAL